MNLQRERQQARALLEQHPLPEGKLSGVATGFHDQPWYGKGKGFGPKFPDGSRCYLSINGDDETRAALVEAVKALLRLWEPVAILHVQGSVTGSKDYTCLEVELNAYDLAVIHLGPYHREQKRRIAILLRAVAEAITCRWKTYQDGTRSAS